METLTLTPQTRHLVPCVATVGMFDGVHRGHQYLIGRLCETARARGLAAVAITFDRPPRQVLQAGWTPQLLTSAEKKLQLLSQTPLDACVVLPFTPEMARLSARDFMQLLRQQLDVRVLVTGYDNRFGHNRSEGFTDYVRYGRELGMEVVASDCWTTEGVAASSSGIRQLLREGRVEEGTRLLGYPYALCGQVVHGEHIGTSLGYPTANLQPTEPCQLIPAAGVYAVRVQIGDDPMCHPAMMNIGTRPTFDGHEQTLEVHLLHYAGNLYGQRLTVTFCRWLRGEHAFASAEALKAQLAEDARQAEELLRQS